MEKRKERKEERKKDEVKMIYREKEVGKFSFVWYKVRNKAHSVKINLLSNVTIIPHHVPPSVKEQVIHT